MAYSPNIYNLVNSQPEARNMEWELKLLQALPTARFKVLSETPVVGPDGWPYLLVGTDPEGKESAAKTLSWLSERGIGLVLNPQKSVPDYVLTYGMIWNYRERGEFLSAQESSSVLSPNVGDKICSFAPSFEYLPEYARAILRAFFKDNGTASMKVLVISEPQCSLCFSLEALGQPKAEEHKGILEAISWFLPAHYSLAIMSEKDLPRFYDL